MCNKKASPRSIFVTWLASLNRLYTAHRIQAWWIGCSVDCVVFNTGKESVEHLFFKCTFSAEVWQKVLLVLGIFRRSYGFSQELDIAAKRSRKTGTLSQLYVY